MLAPVLQKFDLTCSESQLESVTEHRGFSGASVFEVDTNEGCFAVRRWPANSLPRERLHGLHRLLQHLQSTGLGFIAVPRQIGRSSSLCKHQGTFWQCEPWLKGIADLQENHSEERISATMAALGEWHMAAQVFKPKQSEKRWFYQQDSGEVPAITERIEILKAWNPQRINDALAMLNRSSAPWAPWSRNYLDRYTQVSEQILSQLSLARSIRVPLQPCLRDVWHEHILLTGNEVTGLIDPSACRTENIAIDLARLLGSLFGDNKADWDNALQHYQIYRPLSHEELFLIEILDQSSVSLSGLSWINRFLSGSSIWEKDPRIPKRLESLLARLTRLCN